VASYKFVGYFKILKNNLSSFFPGLEALPKYMTLFCFSWNWSKEIIINSEKVEILRRHPENQLSENEVAEQYGPNQNKTHIITRAVLSAARRQIHSIP